MNNNPPPKRSLDSPSDDTISLKYPKLDKKPDENEVIKEFNNEVDEEEVDERKSMRRKKKTMSLPVMRSLISRKS
jgi:hypothetical protein